MARTTIENPFVVRKNSALLFRSVKTLVIVAAGLVIVLGVQFGSKHWLLRQLTTDLTSQSVAEQIRRLDAIAAFGDSGRSVLVSQLTNQHDPVAKHAAGLLHDRQLDWIPLGHAIADHKHFDLISELKDVVSYLSAERQTWLTLLFRTTLSETAKHSSHKGEQAHRIATQLLARLRTQSLVTNSLGQNASKLVNQSSPQPDSLKSLPPLLPTAIKAEVSEQKARSQDLHPPTSLSDKTDKHQQWNARERGMPVATLDKGQLTRLANNKDVQETERDTRQAVIPNGFLTVSLLETYATQSVISMLDSPQSKIRDLAQKELARRGFGHRELDMANRLASSDVQIRLELLNELTDRSAVDPIPWLLWLASDVEPEVRLRAVSILGTIPNPKVKQKLRKRLLEESNPSVTNRIELALRGHYASGGRH